MALPNIFSKDVTDNLIARINKLTPSTAAVWGKMNVAQMLAHSNVTYELLFTPEKHPAPKGIKKFILKTFVKSIVVTEKPYKKNSPTGPQFLISDERNFENEKTRLINHINQVQQMGATPFEGKESHSFGVLNAEQWNNMMYKHLDHHLTQFGV